MDENTQNAESTQAKTLEDPEMDVFLLGEDPFLDGSCLAAGTKIAMADGSVKSIEDIQAGDLVLAFDHEAGCLTGSAVHYLFRCIEPKAPFTLRFVDGTELSIVGEHDLFERESLKYVTLSEQNADQHVGRHFYSVAKRCYVELVSAKAETEKTEYYEIYSRKTLNCVANGMLNVADDVDYTLNIYEFGEDLKADPAALAADIEEYGLFENLPEYECSKQDYDDWNMRYVNIIAGKKLKTLPEMTDMRFRFIGMR